MTLRQVMTNDRQGVLGNASPVSSLLTGVLMRKRGRQVGRITLT